MTYEVQLDERAHHQLFSEIPEELRREVIDAPLDLHEDADMMCRPSVFPYPLGYSIYEFFFDQAHGRKWSVTILLKLRGGRKIEIYRLFWSLVP